MEEWLLKGDGLDSVEVQNMDYVLEFDEFVRSIKQNMDTKFSMFLGAGASVESGNGSEIYLFQKIQFWQKRIIT